MKVLEVGVMEDNTKIQIEDWSEDYSFMEYGSTLGTYPISKQTLKGSFSPNINETFRCQFSFNDNDECMEAYSDLLAGRKTLLDFQANIREKEYLNCL